MKLTSQILTIFAASLILCSMSGNAQNKSGGINLSLWKEISTQPCDSSQTSYINLGLVSKINQLKGIGLNLFYCNTANSVYGIQVSGLSNIVKDSTKGIQLGGLTNITGNNATGIIGSGIANVTGNNLRGIGISGLINITGNETKALLLSGLMNITGSTSSGVDIAGLLNIESGGTSKGIKIGGIGNIIGSELSGIAVGGLMNVAGNNMKGIQVSSLINITGGKAEGLQLSGLSNVCVNVNGIQIAGLGNVAKNLNGGQISLVNMADSATSGVQVGLVNYSKSAAKAKFGLVNLNPDTRYQLMIYGGNTTKSNVAMRFRNNLFYTILGLGSHYLDFGKSFSAAAFYRTGLGFELSRNLFLSGDIGYQHIETFDNKGVNDIPARMYSLQVRANIEFQLTKRFGVFASGGYGVTNYYTKSKNYEKKPIAELGIVLF